MFRKRFHIAYCSELAPYMWLIRCDCGYNVTETNINKLEAWKIAEKHVRWIPDTSTEWKSTR